MKIVLHEDNLLFLSRIEAILKNENIAFLTVAGTNRQLDLSEFQAALVNLAANNAIGFVEYVKRESDIPVIGFCGHAEFELRHLGKKAGVDILLSNSNIADKLVDALRSAIVSP